jgi:hypothetical protein
MIEFRPRAALLRLVSVSIVCMGFAQLAPAGMVDTGYLLDTDMRAASLAHIDVLLARDDVGKQLAALGVDPSVVAERLRGLSASEILELEGRLDEQVTGGSALGVIGAVFLVLMILELMGVTDVFKAI